MRAAARRWLSERWQRAVTTATSTPRTRVDARLATAAVLGWVSLAAVLGAPTWLVASIAAGALTGAAVTAAWGRSRSGRWPALVGLALAVIALLLGALLADRLAHPPGLVEALAAEGAQAEVVGRVASDPERRQGPFGGSRVRLLVQVSAVWGRGRSAPADSLVEVTGELTRVPMYGDIVRVRGRLASADGLRVAAARLRAGPTLEVVQPAGRVVAFADRLRGGLRGAMAASPEDGAGLVPALVVGDTSRMPPDLVVALRESGLTHLTAVSGANVSIVLGAVVLTSGWLGLPRWGRPGVALAGLALFVLLARPEPSVLRAAAMGAVGLLGLALWRRASALPALGAAIVLVLVLDPGMARSAGFALSVLATLGLVLFARSWGAHWAARWPPWARPLGPVLAVPVAAQLACAPVIAALQGSISVVGVAANLLSAPLVAPATLGGLAACLLSWWPAAASVAGRLAALPAEGIAAIARTAADQPFAALPWPDGALGAGLLTPIVVGIVALGPRLVRPVRRHPGRFLAAVLPVVALIVPVRLLTWPDAAWAAVFCDIGQGDAAVLRTGPESAVVVDTGPDPRLVRRCLARLGVRTVDALVLTHFHADHVGGLSGVLDVATVGRVLVTPVREPPDVAEQVDRTLASAGLRAEPLRSGDLLHAGRLTARVWAPARSIHAGSTPNNASVALAVDIDGGRSSLQVLMLGDLEREGAHDLLLRLRREPDWRAWLQGVDVLKSPHHGSANLDPGLMQAVAAPLAVISVGAGNDYGHPSPSHVARLQALGCVVLRTDQTGDIAVLTDAAQPTVRVRGSPLPAP